MVRRARVDNYQPADLPVKFEAGTPPIVPAIGLGAAIDYLRDVGPEAIRRHERRLTERAHELLQSIGGIRILGPRPALKAGIVSFTMPRIRPQDIARLLDSRGIAVRAGHHCAMPLHRRFRLAASTRASFYFYNTLAEVDRLGEALIRVKHVFQRRK
jgi:cysteine desulfurase/selenocysteine lyase